MVPADSEESYLTVAYFYCTDRPWNVYRGSPAVRQRFQAMFEEVAVTEEYAMA